MQALGSLIDTPRSARRLANVYRFFRVIEGEDRLLEGNDFEPVLLLLGLLIGFPRQSGDLLRAIAGRKGDEEWEFFVKRLVPERATDGGPLQNVAVDRLSGGEGTAWSQMAESLAVLQAHLPNAGRLERFQAWVPTVACYTFHPWQEIPRAGP